MDGMAWPSSGSLWSEHGVNVSPDSQEDGESSHVVSQQAPQPQVNHFSRNAAAFAPTNTATPAAVAEKRKAQDQVIELLDSDNEEEAPAAKRPATVQQQHSLPHWMAQTRTPVADRIAERAHYIPFPPNFTPDWKNLVPPRAFLSPQGFTAPPQQQGAPVAFELTLLNVNEFTIEAIFQYGTRSTEIRGLRKPIRQMCAQHNTKAIRDSVTQKWRIPLAAYQDVLIFLSHRYRVTGIPPTQLQIAALERERQEKEYPDAATLESYGVPARIAKTLAPFQRGGVDFVREKDGRALIADEMGLGKSIQSVASMAMYMDEWPLLVLTPSGARYHWEHEFRHWLSDVLRKEHVYVMTKGGDVIPRHAKVVIFSYGLIKAIPEGLFRCAICDESHMLKNPQSLRTKTLAPILRNTKRCLLLSGTPAFARPIELWPQLDILRVGQYGWNIDFKDFEDKFGKGNGGTNHRAELHTMLTGTVMIRRLKADILKTLPRKIRTVGRIHCVKTREDQDEFRLLIGKLRQSKGMLGTLMKAHGMHKNGQHDFGHESKEAEEKSQMLDLKKRQFEEGCQMIREKIRHHAAYMPPDEFEALEQSAQATLREQLDYHVAPQSVNPNAGYSEEDEKKHTLTTLYSLTGKVKVPLVVDMLNNWLDDDTKGKVCIFAHHLTFLDALQSKCKLDKKRRKFIRIDGGTSPRTRQDQITAFQTDPSIRVALLGITAAGVAVTLTAASTVWFAELFWTPAIMIQAEDRCHRIGQAAQVKCVYLVARGTLDEVLWQLIEKKFRDLGEFVEGKERYNLVVENVYENNAELLSAIFDSPVMEETEGLDFADSNAMEDLQLSFDDIADLGAEERKMLMVDGEDQLAEPTQEGQTEVSAITLLDDDETDTKPAASDRGLSSNGGEGDDEENDDSVTESQIAARDDSKVSGVDAIPEDSILYGCRLFKVIFSTSRVGLSLKMFHGRVFIFRVLPERREALGEDSKPEIGDILVSVGGYPLPLHNDIDYILKFTRYFLQNPPVELQFVEAPRAAFEFLNSVASPAIARLPIASQEGNEVIELLDDD